MKKEMKKKKGRETAFLWSVGICVVVCVAVVAVFLLADPVAAMRQRKQAMGVLDSGEIRMVVSDPASSGIAFDTASGGEDLSGGDLLGSVNSTMILTDAQANAIRDELAWALGSCRFDRREASLTGLWFPSVTVVSREDRAAIYLSDEGICLVENEFYFVYTFREQDAARYGALRDAVLGYIEGAKAAK